MARLSPADKSPRQRGRSGASQVYSIGCALHHFMCQISRVRSEARTCPNQIQPWQWISGACTSNMRGDFARAQPAHTPSRTSRFPPIHSPCLLTSSPGLRLVVARRPPVWVDGWMDGWVVQHMHWAQRMGVPAGFPSASLFVAERLVSDRG